MSFPSSPVNGQFTIVNGKNYIYNSQYNSWKVSSNVVTVFTNTSYRTKSEFTATLGQTTFTVPAYTVGYIDVYRNGVLLGSADYTATTGTTVVLANASAAGDLIATESFYTISPFINAIPATANSVGNNYLAPLSYIPTSGANLTLPTGGGTALSTANPQSGGVIQVVNATSTSSVSTTSATFVTTGFSASITPKFSTSRILVIVNGNIYIGSSNVGSFTVYRGATNLSNGTSISAQTGAYASGTAIVAPVAMSFLDSPATTSSTTYTVYFATTGGTLYFNYPPGVQSSNFSSFTLMEIAA